MSGDTAKVYDLPENTAAVVKHVVAANCLPRGQDIYLSRDEIEQVCAEIERCFELANIDPEKSGMYNALVNALMSRNTQTNPAAQGSLLEFVRTEMIIKKFDQSDMTPKEAFCLGCACLIAYHYKTRLLTLEQAKEKMIKRMQKCINLLPRDPELSR